MLECLCSYLSSALDLSLSMKSTSFKQQDPAPRYHARSAAIVLAQMYAGAKTLWVQPHLQWRPIIRTTGPYGLVELTGVIKISICRHRSGWCETSPQEDDDGPFSPCRWQRSCFKRGERYCSKQTWFAPMVDCSVDGYRNAPALRCVVTYHKNLKFSHRHYWDTPCGCRMSAPCCESKDIRGRGYGTEGDWRRDS